MFSDELIGKTMIDMEDRYFDHDWLDIKDKPIETRRLYHPDLKAPQGSIVMWLEIVEREKKTDLKEWDIKLPPVVNMQSRLVIWSTRDIPCMDVEEVSDVYVAAFLDPKKSQTTDTHFRCSSGEASFNWRCLETIPYHPKHHNTKLQIQVYDKDLFAPDDYICSASLNLKPFIQQIYDLDMPFTFSKTGFNNTNPSEELKKMIQFEEEEKFWINCTREDENGNQVASGGVLCSLEILPMWKAEQVQVGSGRDEPNCNPFLPPPTGRIVFSLNPFVLIGQLVGPRIRNKFVMWVCGIMITMFITSFLPGMIKHLIAEVSNPFNYMGK